VPRHYFALVLGASLAATSIAPRASCLIRTLGPGRGDGPARPGEIQEGWIGCDVPRHQQRCIQRSRTCIPSFTGIDGTLHVRKRRFSGIRGQELHDMRDQDGKFYDPGLHEDRHDDALSGLERFPLAKSTNQLG